MYAASLPLRPALIRVGPFSVFFTNVNTEMKLAGHSHFGLVDLFYRATAPNRLTFPSFADTHSELSHMLQLLLDKPLEGMSNEDVAAMLFCSVAEFRGVAAERRGGEYTLERLDLSVRGVPDRIGHADGFSTYTVERGP